jgi:predicted kinase
VPRGRSRRPLILVLAGLPGTGKSTLARAVARRRRAVWLRVDLVEAALLRSGIARSFATGLAAYEVARDLARDHLLLGHDVVIDAVNGVEEARRMWRELADETGARRRVVEVVLADRAEHRRRISDRGSANPPLPAVSWKEVVGREYLPWTEPTLVLEGGRPIATNARRIDEYCDGPSPGGHRRRRGR